MYPYLRSASLEEQDDLKILEMLQKQPKEYIQSFRAFPFTRESIREHLENRNNKTVLIFVGNNLAAFGFVRYSEEYKNYTTGNVTDYYYRNNGLAQLSIVWLKSWSKLHNRYAEFKAHVDNENIASQILMKKTGIQKIE